MLRLSYGRRHDQQRRHWQAAPRAASASTNPSGSNCRMSGDRHVRRSGHDERNRRAVALGPAGVGRIAAAFRILCSDRFVPRYSRNGGVIPTPASEPGRSPGPCRVEPDANYVDGVSSGREQCVTRASASSGVRNTIAGRPREERIEDVGDRMTGSSSAVGTSTRAVGHERQAEEGLVVAERPEEDRDRTLVRCRSRNARAAPEIRDRFRGTIAPRRRPTRRR